MGLYEYVGNNPISDTDSNGLFNYKKCKKAWKEYKIEKDKHKDSIEKAKKANEKMLEAWQKYNDIINDFILPCTEKASCKGAIEKCAKEESKSTPEYANYQKYNKLWLKAEAAQFEQQGIVGKAAYKIKKHCLPKLKKKKKK